MSPEDGLTGKKRSQLQRCLSMKALEGKNLTRKNPSRVREYEGKNSSRVRKYFTHSLAEDLS